MNNSRTVGYIAIGIFLVQILPFSNGIKLGVTGLLCGILVTFAFSLTKKSNDDRSQEDYYIKQEPSQTPYQNQMASNFNENEEPYQEIFYSETTLSDNNLEPETDPELPDIHEDPYNKEPYGR